MLQLDSPAWAELRCAYGPASDIPGLLRALPAAPIGADYKTEPWFTLWSSLCHQRDVYPASFAAVPHIVEAASARPAAERLEYLHLVAYIECCRHTPRAPSIPEHLEEAYQSALSVAAELTAESLRCAWDERSYRALLGGLASFRGFPQLGSAIIDLEREIDCPSCGHTFLSPGFEVFTS